MVPVFVSVRLPFDRTFYLQFWKLPLANETGLSGISGKWNKRLRYTDIFGNFLPGILVPVDFLPEFTEEIFG